MKKSILIILLLIIVLMSFVFTGISEIVTESANIKKNDLENSESFVVENVKLVQTINSIITGRIYYNQPLIKSYSQNEIDYELNMYEFDENRVMTKWYRILLNSDKSTSISNRSRVDILDLRSGYSDYTKGKSLLLSPEQSKKLILCIEELIN